MDCLSQDDPINQQSLIGKTVKITTVNKDLHEGIIYIIDPISKTIILIEENESKKALNLLMFRAITSLEITNKEVNVESSFFANNLLFESDIEDRRVRLRNWFKKNLIDISEDGLVLRIQDMFSITPPYTIDQCVCNNKLVLERMIGLIEKMP